MRTHIALIRGINVGRSPRIPMIELRSLCSKLGWQDVQTWIQSGNVIFRSAETPRRLERQLEAALPGAFAVSASVVIRDAATWLSYVHGNPFRKASEATPNLVMLAVSQELPAAGALAQLRERADAERLEQVGDVLWIHYADGAGRSRLTPGLLDRAVGSPTTTRNWRTVWKLAELARAPVTR